MANARPQSTANAEKALAKHITRLERRIRTLEMRPDSSVASTAPPSSYMKITAAAGQVINGGGATPIDFDIVAESAGTVFSLGGAGQLTVSEAGAYLFGTQFFGSLSGAALDYVNARLEKNGIDDFGDDYIVDLGNGTAAISVAVPVVMAAGDYVEALVWPVPPGATVTLGGDGTDPNGPVLWGVKLP